MDSNKLLEVFLNREPVTNVDAIVRHFVTDKNIVPYYLLDDSASVYGNVFLKTTYQVPTVRKKIKEIGKDFKFSLKHGFYAMPQSLVYGYWLNVL